MAAKPAEPLIKGPFGPNAGASIGWNQATAADNATTMASVTGADGPWGASVAYERNPQGKNFVSAGWAGGAGFAVQGPPLLNWTWDIHNGVQWVAPK